MKKRRRNRRTGRSTLKFAALGGVEDINRNCYVVEYGKDIVVMDLGLSFPDDDLYGVNYIIPDVEYLVKRKDRIRGIVISHGHLDHVGALPYVIEKLGFPTIYGREFTVLFILEKLKEYGLDKRVSVEIVEPKQDIKLGAMSAKLIPVTHAIPQSSSILIDTPDGSVIYTGDYKFDESPVRDEKPDYEMFREIGKKGINLACMDSTNVFETGKSRSEAEVAKVLDKIVKNARGRVISATFSSLGSRLYSLIEIAKKYDRRVVITGRSMKTMINLLREIDYVELDEKLIINENKVKGVPDEKLLILTTGSQGEEMAALSRMSRGEHRGIRIKDTDTVILSSSVIPGNQEPVQNLIDDLLRLGAKVIHQSFMDVHTSGHGYQDDMKLMYEMLSPEFVMPVHGFRSFIHEAAYLLGRWGMKQKNILHPETGLQFEFDPATKTWKEGHTIDCRNIYVEGPVVGETDAEMIGDRRRMAENGVMWISIGKGRGGRSAVQIRTRGVMNESLQKPLLKEISANITATLKNSQDRRLNERRSSVRKSVAKTVASRIGKEPIIEVDFA